MSTTERWWEGVLHVVDFEGTRASGIIEVGVVTCAGGRWRQVATEFCRATGPVVAADRRTHGLRGTEGAEIFARPAQWETWVARRREGILVAHHAPVEAGLLAAAWPYPPYGPDWREPGREVATWGPWLDTRRLAAAVWPGMETYGLGSLVATLGYQADLDALAATACPAGRRHYHCALYDALAAAVLLRAAAEVAPWRDLGLPELLARLGDAGDAAELF